MEQPQRRALLCALGSPGFVHSLVGVAHALRTRAIASAFATSIEFEPLLAAEGFDRIPRGDRDGPSFMVGRWWDPLHVAMQVKHIEYAADRYNPDLLVANQLGLGALIVAERRRIPVAVLGLAAYLWPATRRRGLDQAVQLRTFWQHSDMLRHFNAARAVFRLPALPDEPFNSPLLGDLFLLQAVPQLLPELDALPPQVRFVGSCTWEPAHATDEFTSWLEMVRALHAPIVYMQLARSFDSPSPWPALREALDAGPVFAAVSTSRMDVDTGVLGSNIFARPYVPQGRVLPEARAVVATGHSTAVLGALERGVPMLLLPNGSGSLDIAQACATAGVARVLYGEEQLSRCSLVLRSVLEDDALRTAATRMAQHYASIGGPAAAAASIEECFFGCRTSAFAASIR